VTFFVDFAVFPVSSWKAVGDAMARVIVPPNRPANAALNTRDFFEGFIVFPLCVLD
jgi:hypothetical protein